MSTQKPALVFDDIRRVLRQPHYSRHTERAYCGWIKRYVRFHGITSRDDLQVAYTIAALVRGGTFPLAYAYPPAWHGAAATLREITHRISATDWKRWDAKSPIRPPE